MAVVPLNARVLMSGDITQATEINGLNHVQFTVIDDSASTQFVLNDIVYVAEPNYIDVSLFDVSTPPNTKYLAEDIHAVVQMV